MDFLELLLLVLPSGQFVLEPCPLSEAALGLFLIFPEVFLREDLIELFYLQSDSSSVKDNL
jgi:hypothetical protein